MAFPKIEGYVVTEKLGSGSYSTVYKAYTKVGARSVVAIKCVDKARIKHSGSAVDNLVTEIRLLKTLRHPHIVTMHNFTWDDRNIYIIMEYCSGGDLSKYIHKYGRIPESRVLYFLQQLATALKFLREKGVVHMDLKPHNLLLHKGSDGKYILKVADFGFAAVLTSRSAGGARGSPLYMAPEMLHEHTHDAAVDLWSVGVIMYECLFGRAPYASATFRELLDKIERKAPIEIPTSPLISAGCRDLLTRLLRHDPAERISYEEFFAHEYLDLEHMPTRENYEKAVQLMRLAVERDAVGRLPEALALYTASLQLLVPAVRGETDPGAKNALTVKLNRYMERAEEIKQYLKYGECAPNVPNFTNSSGGNVANAPFTAHGVRGTDLRSVTNSRGTAATVGGGLTSCCRSSGANTVNSYDFSNMRTTKCNPCTCAKGTQSCSCASVSETEDVNGTVEQPAAIDEQTQPAPNSTSAEGSQKPGRLRRLFGRGSPPSPLPQLPAAPEGDDDDNEEPNQKGRSEADGCRIT